MMRLRWVRGARREPSHLTPSAAAHAVAEIPRCHLAVRFILSLGEAAARRHIRDTVHTREANGNQGGEPRKGTKKWNHPGGEPRRGRMARSFMPPTLLHATPQLEGRKPVASRNLLADRPDATRNVWPTLRTTENLEASNNGRVRHGDKQRSEIPAPRNVTTNPCRLEALYAQL